MLWKFLPLSFKEWFVMKFHIERNELTLLAKNITVNIKIPSVERNLNTLLGGQGRSNHKAFWEES